MLRRLPAGIALSCLLGEEGVALSRRRSRLAPRPWRNRQFRSKVAAIPLAEMLEGALGREGLQARTSLRGSGRLGFNSDGYRNALFTPEVVGRASSSSGSWAAAKLGRGRRTTAATAHQTVARARGLRVQRQARLSFSVSLCYEDLDWSLSRLCRQVVRGPSEASDRVAGDTGTQSVTPSPRACVAA